MESTQLEKKDSGKKGTHARASAITRLKKTTRLTAWYQRLSISVDTRPLEYITVGMFCFCGRYKKAIKADKPFEIQIQFLKAIWSFSVLSIAFAFQLKRIDLGSN